jgi:oligoribonuclease (3'-5' exoribonuclease)
MTKKEPDKFQVARSDNEHSINHATAELFRLYADVIENGDARTERLEFVEAWVTKSAAPIGECSVAVRVFALPGSRSRYKPLRIKLVVDTVDYFDPL